MLNKPDNRMTLDVFLCLGILVLNAVLAYVDETQPSKPKFHISKETTHLLSPVRKDGTIDYVAGLNALSNRGVTRDNNAVAVLVQVCSQEQLKDTVLVEYHQKLGITAEINQQQRMLTREEFASRIAPAENAAFQEQLDKEYYQGLEGPWSPALLPKLAAWLEINNEPLSSVENALKRPEWYWPIVISNSESGLLSGLPYSGLNTMCFAQALSVRAMLAAHEVRADDAIRDLLACHQLARGIRPGLSPTVSIAHAIELLACSCDINLLASGILTRRQLSVLAQALATLPPLPSADAQFNLTERCASLESVLHLTSTGLKGLDDILAFPEGVPPATFQTIQSFYDQIDWDIPLRMVNDQYDLIHLAMTKAHYSERTAAFAELQKRVYAIREEYRAPNFSSKLATMGRVDRIRLSRSVGAIVIVGHSASPQISRSLEDRAISWLHLTQMAVALQRYQDEHGRFPVKLAELQPRFLEVLPDDIYSAGPFRYESKNNGFLLYSVGENARDDNGNTFRSSPKGDDLVVRIPPK